MYSKNDAEIVIKTGINVSVQQVWKGHQVGKFLVTMSPEDSLEEVKGALDWDKDIEYAWVIDDLGEWVLVDPHKRVDEIAKGKRNFALKVQFFKI